MSSSLYSVSSRVLKLNREATRDMGLGLSDLGFTKLTKANDLIREHRFPRESWLRGLTSNNFGCYYKRTGQLQVALDYFFDALRREARSKTDLAGYHLNICTVFSQLNKHRKALDHAFMSYQLLNEQSIRTAESINAMAITYLNIGIEYKLIHKIDEATYYLKKGWDYSLKHLGNSTTTKSLANAYIGVNTPLFQKDKLGRYSQTIKHRFSPNKSFRSVSKRAVMIRNNRQRDRSENSSKAKTISRYKFNSRSRCRNRPLPTCSPGEYPFISSTQHLRPILKKRKNQMNAHQLEEHAVVIQKWVRMFQTKRLYQSVRDAALYIQRWYKNLKRVSGIS